MVTLGVYSGPGGRAAAVAADGRLVSAVSEGADAHAGGPLPLETVAACLAAGGIDAREITEIVVATEPGAASAGNAPPAVPRAQRSLAAALRDVRLREVQRLCADVTQTARTIDDGLVLCLDGVTGRSALLPSQPDTQHRPRPLDGSTELFAAARTLAVGLGLQGDHPLAALEAAAGPDADTFFPHAVSAIQGNEHGWQVDTDATRAWLAHASAQCSGPLDDHDAIHVGDQRTRAAVAAAALRRIGHTIAAVANAALPDNRGSAIAFGGSAFSGPALRAHVSSAIEAAAFALVPEPIGAALGAALFEHPHAVPIAHVALGAAASEQDIKATLDNCRLEYVYEPDWSRLYTRVSGLLASGATVAWYQGRQDFGSQSFGSRSILCDPASRFARDNINVFLLHRDVHAPLPVSLAATGSAPERAAPFAYRVHAPGAGPGGALGSALDRQGGYLAHVTNQASHPELHQLLAVHGARTGAAGLINVPLGANGMLAATPRQAIQATFTAAVDVLVIGRFIVSKDYWLVRRQAPA